MNNVCLFTVFRVQEQGVLDSLKMQECLTQGLPLNQCTNGLGELGSGFVWSVTLAICAYK